MILGIDLDHVAIGLHDRAPLWDLLLGSLGGTWAGGGDTIGFSSAQVRFANGMKVEGLEPFQAEQNDFLARFLARSGPGPHHLTFKVPDIERALAQAEEAGYPPVGVDLSDPGWKEGFLHPKSSTGVVVQLAQSAGDWEPDAPSDLPAPQIDAPATLVHVCHAVADLEGALRLWKGLLGGTTVDAGAGGGLGWVDLCWPGPGRIRLVSGPPVEAWLDGRDGRVHHLGFRLPGGADPAAVPGAVDRGEWFEIAPAEPIGTRFVIDVTAGPGFPIASVG